MDPIYINPHNFPTNLDQNNMFDTLSARIARLAPLSPQYFNILIGRKQKSNCKQICRLMEEFKWINKLLHWNVLVEELIVKEAPPPMQLDRPN